jgi:hypothetical protein
VGIAALLIGTTERLNAGIKKYAITRDEADEMLQRINMLILYEIKRAGIEQAEVKQAEVKQAEVKQAEVKQAEVKQAEGKQAEVKQS